MRRLIGTLIGALVLAAPVFASTSPTLKLQSLDPLVVRGAAFRPAERIRVTLVAPGLTEKRRLRASRHGTFRADFGDVQIGRCGGFTVRAVGGSGNATTLKRPPLPACMP